MSPLNDFVLRDRGCELCAVSATEMVVGTSSSFSSIVEHEALYTKEFKHNISYHQFTTNKLHNYIKLAVKSKVRSTFKRHDMKMFSHRNKCKQNRREINERAK